MFGQNSTLSQKVLIQQVRVSQADQPPVVSYICTLGSGHTYVQQSSTAPGPVHTDNSPTNIHMIQSHFFCHEYFLSVRLPT